PRKVSAAVRTRRISEPSLDPETKEDVEPAHLTVQGLPSHRRKNSTLSISSFANPNALSTSSRKTTRAAAQCSVVPDDTMQDKPEDYLRYLSNLSTVTVTNNGREFRDVPAYLQQFEMSRRGTSTISMSQPVRRRMSIQEQAAPLPTIPETPKKPPNKIKQTVCCALSRHREFGFRHVILALALAAYAVAGMFMFHAIEVPFERQNVIATRDALNNAFNILAHDFEIAATIPNVNRTLLLKKAYLTLIKIDGKYTGSTFYKLEERDYPLWTWTYGTAYFFAFTLYSTVGYGSIAPSTELGRLVVIPYTAIGFPFALVIVRYIGSSLLVYITRAYAKLLLQIRQARGYEPSSNEGIRLPCKVAFLMSFSWVFITALLVRAYDTWLGPDPTFSVFHSFYFCFLSYAAVGLGDIMPTNYGHAPLVVIFIMCCMPFMRVINRVLYVGIEHRMFGTVSIVEDALDRCAPEEQRGGVNTVSGTVEASNGGNSLSTLDEDYSEDEEDSEEREEHRIHDELRNNFTVHPSSTDTPHIQPQNENQTANQAKQ
ncbi:hypothetical protein PRIPAC_76957, partial [Pristionchus pacificus]|uniref:Ion channel n=1 Tax=Pristionchus pacificus TaxID=54126 RepID=A0A2A6CPA9_PRIPA